MNEHDDIMTGPLCLENWTNGGTCVTNFRYDMLPVYERAVADYKGLFTLSISMTPMLPLKAGSGYGSLHCEEGYSDLSDFWYRFEEIRVEFNTMLKERENNAP